VEISGLISRSSRGSDLKGMGPCPSRAWMLGKCEILLSIGAAGGYARHCDFLTGMAINAALAQGASAPVRRIVHGNRHRDNVFSVF
jgi:hypothetical protein